MNSGAILEKIIQILPAVARAIAEPLSKTEKMVFVSGGAGGPSGGAGGPAAYTREFQRIIAEMPEVVNAITGVDLHQAVQNLTAADTGAGVAVARGLAQGAAMGSMMNGKNVLNP